MERRANGKFAKTPSKHHLNMGMAKAEKMESKIGTKMAKAETESVMGAKLAKTETERMNRQVR